MKAVDIMCGICLAIMALFLYLFVTTDELLYLGLLMVNSFLALILVAYMLWQSDNPDGAETVFTVLYSMKWEGDTLLGVFESEAKANDWIRGQEAACEGDEYIIVSSKLNEEIKGGN